MRKTGSRRIVVDGTAYRWRVRHRGTRRQADRGIGPPPPVSDPRVYGLPERLHVGVELAEAGGSVLVVYTPHRHPGHFDILPCEVVPVRPSDVAEWIRQARQAGWQPSERGPQFHLLVTGGPSRQAEPGAAPDRPM